MFRFNLIEKVALWKVLAFGLFLTMPQVSLGDLLYTFSSAGSSLNPFTVQINTPNFIGPGPLSFSPFLINSGGNSYTMSKGLAAVYNFPDPVYGHLDFCFNFGTANTGLFSDANCSSSQGPTDALLRLAFRGAALPSATGTYVPEYEGFTVGASSVINPQVTLTISGTPASAVPEPSTDLLMAVGILLLCYGGKRRSRPGTDCAFQQKQ